MNYRKYTWIGNQITEDDMKKLYHMKKAKGMPITRLVSLAVREFIQRTEKEANNVQES